MKKNTLFFFFVMSLLMVSSVPKAQETTLATDREYVIGIGDSLKLETVVPYARSVTVRSDGKITLPDLGDIQAAGLKKSTFEATLSTLLGKYLKDPRVTVTVMKSTELLIKISGAINRQVSTERRTTLSQVLRQIYQNLQQLRPVPRLQDMKVISAEQEEFPVNGIDLVEGNVPDIRLEWGDTIHIPRGELPTPTPAPEPAVRPTPPAQKARISMDQFELLVQQYPEKEEILREIVEEVDEQTYTIDIEKHREELDEDVIATLKTYAAEQTVAPPPNIILAGINVNLAYEPPLEAFLAIPDLVDPTQPPAIKRVREGELVEKGETETENVFLKEIRDTENMVVLQKGDREQELSLSQQNLSNAKLSGILNIGKRKRAFFSDIETSENRQIITRGGFYEGDEIENGVILAMIAEKWVLLEKEQNFQLILLRDSFHRPPVAQPVSSEPEQGLLPPLPSETEAVPDTQSMLPVDIMKQAMPAQIKALDSFSKLFFATPIF